MSFALILRIGGSDCAALQVAFIKQEAMEKAREIKVKADEEFAIEKVQPRSALLQSTELQLELLARPNS